MCRGFLCCYLCNNKAYQCVINAKCHDTQFYSIDPALKQGAFHTIALKDSTTSCTAQSLYKLWLNDWCEADEWHMCGIWKMNSVCQPRVDVTAYSQALTEDLALSDIYAIYRTAGLREIAESIVLPAAIVEKPVFSAHN